MSVIGVIRLWNGGGSMGAARCVLYKGKREWKMEMKKLTHEPSDLLVYTPDGKTYAAKNISATELKLPACSWTP